MSGTKSCVSLIFIVDFGGTVLILEEQALSVTLSGSLRPVSLMPQKFFSNCCQLKPLGNTREEKFLMDYVLGKKN